jgi:isopenicillin N synthase-like dioxygenase
LEDLRHALANVGFCVLVNHPDFVDESQKRWFSTVRHFFDASDDDKATGDIALSPYYRGWSKDKRAMEGKIPAMLAQEAYQYGFDQEKIADHDDKTVPIYKRLFRGPNTWPDAHKFPDFKPTVDDLTDRYHRCTHDLGHLICESIGADTAKFDHLFPFEDPDLAASLNHNFGMAGVPPEYHDKVKAEFAKPFSPHTSTHIDGPPFIALLVNDRPGLQVFAGEGESRWLNAPVTCRTEKGDYAVPVIPGAVIVNSGGTLMHLSKGKVVATLHRVNTTLVPPGSSRVSLPFFLIPKMEGALTPFFEDKEGETTGYQEDRDRGTNAAVNRMQTFPQCTRKWWMKEFKELHKGWLNEVGAEQNAALTLAKKRGKDGRAAL